MKSLKLVVLSCLSLCVSQMQAMKPGAGKPVGKHDVTTKPVDHITDDATAEAEKDAAKRSQAQHEQSGQPVDPTLKEKQVDESEPTQRVSKPDTLNLGKVDGDEFVINEPKEEIPTEDTIYRNDVESEPVLFKKEDLVTKDGDLAKISRSTSKGLSQWISSIIESLQRIFSGIPKTPRIDVALKDATNKISTILKDPALEDNDSLKRSKINNELQSLADVIAEESSPEVFEKVNQELKSFSADIQDGLKHYYHDAFRVKNQIADDFGSNESRYKNIPQDSSSTNRYVNFDIE